MATFAQTINPTPFGVFDAETAFQTEADAMVRFVKLKLGDSTLSVELSKKDIWACFEEATLKYSMLVQQTQIASQLVNMLGVSTASIGDMTNKYPRSSLEYLMRLAEPYAEMANVMGSQDPILGYIPLVSGQQDYDIYDTLVHATSGTNIFRSQPSGSQTKLRIIDVFHFNPIAAQQFLLNASNITNFLATNFNYESYVNSTVFYVLPVFEDVLRRGMLEEAFKVRRSQYSYEIIGKKIRIFPIPVTGSTFSPNGDRLYMRVAYASHPLEPSYDDQSISGSVTGPHDIPFRTNIPYASINTHGRHWIREYCLALCKELLGIVRTKLETIPIPGADLKLNGAELIAQAREDKTKLVDTIVEWLKELTSDKLQEKEALRAENIAKQLAYVPIAKPIFIG